MIALWAFKVEVGFASTLLGAMVFLMSLTYFTNHSDQDGCTGPTISRLFFGCHLLELCYTIHQHSFIRLKCNPWFISINPWFICSYINPLRSVMFLYVHINLPLPKIPKDPRSSNTPNPAPGYPQIYLWSHQSDHRHFLRRIQPAMSIQTGVDHTGLVFLSTDLRS